MKKLYFKETTDWRQWLQNNHDNVDSIWLVFYKKHTDKPTLEYEEAVREALCFGWIDSIIKKLDEEKYVRKFTPRKNKSNWSALNKKRALKLIQQGRMTKYGMRKVNKAKQNGEWDKPERDRNKVEMPLELKEALQNNIKAKNNFEELAPSYQRRYMDWIGSGTRQKTREKRVLEAIKLLEKGKMLGMR